MANCRMDFVIVYFGRILGTSIVRVEDCVHDIENKKESKDSNLARWDLCWSKVEKF